MEYMSGQNGTGRDRYAYANFVAQIDAIAPVITGNLGSGVINTYYRSFTTSFATSEGLIAYDL